MDNQILNARPKNGYGFVYCYTSPSGKKYIGQTKTTLKERANTKNYKGYKGCSAFYHALQKYGIQNFEVEILCEVPIEVLTETETQYILYYDTTNKEKGYNIMTDYISFVSSLRAVPVFCYDKETGKYVAEYPSLADAERYYNVYHGAVRKALNHPERTCANLFCRTQKLDSVEVLEPKKINKEVYIYDSKTGDFLIEFPSIREASRNGYGDRRQIQRHLAGLKGTDPKWMKYCKYIYRSFKVDNVYSGSSTTIEVVSSETKREQQEKSC